MENQEYQTAQGVIERLRKNWLTGDTGILYTTKGMFVQDNPQLKDGRIVTPDFEALEARLGKTEEKGVIFSDDRNVRFTPYGFKRDSQTALDLAKNPGVVALVGSEENAERLARVSSHYKLNPYFWALTNVDSPQTRVAGLDTDVFGGRLVVDAGGSEDLDYRFSFGVLDETSEAGSPKIKQGTGTGESPVI